MDNTINTQTINQIFINAKNLVEAKYQGDQTEEDIASTYKQQLVLADQIARKGLPRNFLIDVSSLGKTTADSRKRAVEYIDKLEVNKLAVFGGNTFNRHLVNLILRAIGKTHLMKYFSSREEAEKWLAK